VEDEWSTNNKKKFIALIPDERKWKIVLLTYYNLEKQVSIGEGRLSVFNARTRTVGDDETFVGFEKNFSTDLKIN
jgi:hypothetical protein